MATATNSSMIPNENIPPFDSSRSNRISSHKDASSLLAIQTMKSVLSFLCAMNADSREVERFLLRYPESLLFEGTEDDTGVETAVLSQMEQCSCFGSSCNENRKKVLKLVKRGFEHYKSIALMTTAGDDLVFRKMVSTCNLDAFRSQLQSLQSDLNAIKRKFEFVQIRISESQAHRRDLRFELEGISRNETSNRAALTLIACQRKKTIERRLMLENNLGVATVSAMSLEQERDSLLEESRTANRLKTAILKSAFVGCRRHVCEASKPTEEYLDSHIIERS